MDILLILKNTFHCCHEKAKPSLSFLQNKVSQVALVVFGIMLATAAGVLSFRYFFKSKKEKKEIAVKQQTNQQKVKLNQNVSDDKKTNDLRIEEAKKMGHTLKELDLIRSSINDDELINLLEACPNIHDLDLTDCPNFKGEFIKKLPKSLLGLNLSRIDVTDWKFSALPENLYELNLSHCKGLNKFGVLSHLSENLIELDLSYNNELTFKDLLNLPKSLEFLSLTDCDHLENLDVSYLNKLKQVKLTRSNFNGVNLTKSNLNLIKLSNSNQPAVICNGTVLNPRQVINSWY